MDISFADLKEKEIINVLDGKKLGHINDVLFDINTGVVKGVLLPGERRFFRRSDDVFIPLEKIRRIGDDVILVKIQIFSGGAKSGLDNGYINDKKYANYMNYNRPIVVYNNDYDKTRQDIRAEDKLSTRSSYVRFKPIDNKKYK